MIRMLCKTAYDGTEYSGWQVQPNARTVQAEIESALARIHKGRSVRIHGSGRTDAHVHAHGQMFHFDTELDIPAEGWRRALNAGLPDDVLIRSVVPVDPQFHARFDVKKKEYRYRVLLAPEADVFRRRYTLYMPHKLDVERMRQAGVSLVGTHDFSSFCAANASAADKIRTLFAVDVIENGDELMFRLQGNGFLYQMVRIIVGTLLEVGTGRREPNEVSAILHGRDRTLAGKTAPGHGLFLWEVSYHS
ncbi:MAG TPA: tRNA pseudouridine(38-40) synthase TruA [Bacillales bacterium]|nr:tRNA pseudouridine(38-40) synthase TruA [Bacillales bacterium]